MTVTSSTADEADGPGGIPLAPSSHPTGPRPVAPVAAADPGREDPDDGEVDQGDAVGVRRQRIDGSTSRPVPAGESTLLGRAEAEEEGRYAALLATLDPAPPVWARWVGSAGVVWLVVLGGVVLALFVLAQAALLVAQVEARPPVWRAAGYAAAAVLVGACAVAGGRVGVLFVRLRRSPAFRTDALYELAARQKIRADYARRVFDHVADRLRPLLAAYPLDGPAAARLRGWGADEGQIAGLRAARDRLLPAREGTTAWVEEFRARFLAVLDEIARARIWRATVTAGKLTAISPRGTIDALVVSVLAVDLVRDLCGIYHLKAGRVDTVRILGTVFLGAGVASEADDWAQTTAGHLFDSVSLDGLAGLAGKAVAPVVGAVADGAINAALIRRVGRLTVRAVRPLQ